MLMQQRIVKFSLTMLHYVNSYLRKGQITMELTDHIQALKHVTEFLCFPITSLHMQTQHIYCLIYVGQCTKTFFINFPDFQSLVFSFISLTFQINHSVGNFHPDLCFSSKNKPCYKTPPPNIRSFF